jgi:hypothetical protein
MHEIEFYWELSNGVKTYVLAKGRTLLEDYWTPAEVADLDIQVDKDRLGINEISEIEKDMDHIRMHAATLMLEEASVWKIS